MELLEQIEAYLARSGVAPSTFGRQAAGDPRLVADLKAGRRPRHRTQDRVMSFLATAESTMEADCWATQSHD
jgi:hypothetical protein